MRASWRRLEHSPKSPPLLQNGFEDLYFIFKIYAILKFHSIICNRWVCFTVDILDIKYYLNYLPASGKDAPGRGAVFVL